MTIQTKVFNNKSDMQLEADINAFLLNVTFIGLEYALIPLPNSEVQYSAIVVYQEKTGKGQFT